MDFLGEELAGIEKKANAISSKMRQQVFIQMYIWYYSYITRDINTLLPCVVLFFIHGVYLFILKC